MNPTNSTITCPSCSFEFELSAALTKDIEKTVLAAEHKKHEDELKKQRTELEAQAKKDRESLVSGAKKGAEEKLAFQMDQLKEDAADSKKQNKELQEQLVELTKELRETRKSAESANLEMQKTMAAEEVKIREQALKEASEAQELKLQEKDKQLSDARKANDDLQRKLNQGSQQTQGEVLELDLEDRLKSEFPIDTIEDVKKGVRGADIKHWVNNAVGAKCGMILWETKNAKWQPSWITKFKQDVREANANIGIIVSAELPEGIDSLMEIEPLVWVVKPALAGQLASALRRTILEVDTANKMAAGKDDKMDLMYQYLTGPEFKHRVEAIVDSYTILQNEIEREKRWYAQKWAKQEKAIRGVIDNTLAMHGDLQGITNSALQSIDALELEAGE